MWVLLHGKERVVSRDLIPALGQDLGGGKVLKGAESVKKGMPPCPLLLLRQWMLLLGLKVLGLLLLLLLLLLPLLQCTLLLGLLVLRLLLLLLLLPLGRSPPRVGGERMISPVVSGALPGLDVGATTEVLLMVLCAADGVEGGEGKYCPDAGMDGRGGGSASHRWVGWIWTPWGR